MEVEFPFDMDAFFRKYEKAGILPKNDFEKQAILLVLLREFGNGVYSEDEVNSIIRKRFDDAALIRRELVNFGYMKRDPEKAEYRVAKRSLTYEDVEENTLLRRHAASFIGKS